MDRALGGGYASIAAVLADLDQMLANAHLFNEPGSQVGRGASCG